MRRRVGLTLALTLALVALVSGQVQRVPSQSAGGPGTGTAARLAKWATTTTLGDSLLADDGTNVTLGSGQLRLPDGTAGAPSLAFTNDLTMGLYRSSLNSLAIIAPARVQFVSGGTERARLDISSADPWFALGSSQDVRLYRDAAAAWAVRNGANAQTLRVYRSFTDASNYSRLALNDNQLKSEAAGTGTLTETASRPLLDLAQTWNSGGVTFTALKANVTDTASAAASLLLDLQVGGVSKFSVRKDGVITAGSLAPSFPLLPANATVSAPSYSFASYTNSGWYADGCCVKFAVGGVNRLGFSTTEVTVQSTYALAWGTIGSTVDVAIGRVSAGLLYVTDGGGNYRDLRLRALESTGYAFASLPAATNGTELYCSDCTFANPCASGGTGAFAKRLNGAWRCD